jgi:hypothetical protein
MRFADDNKQYLLDSIQMRAFETVMHRLYAEKPLTGDERRDLANKLYSLLNSVIEMDIGQ